MRNAECGIDGRLTAPDASAVIPHSTFHIPHSYEPSAGARAPRRGLSRARLADPARGLDGGRASLLQRRLPAEPVWRSGIAAHAEPSRGRARPLSGPPRGPPATGYGDRRDRRRGRLRMDRVRPRGGRTDRLLRARLARRGSHLAEASSGRRARDARDHRAAHPGDGVPAAAAGPLRLRQPPRAPSVAGRGGGPAPRAPPGAPRGGAPCPGRARPPPPPPPPPCPGAPGA